MKFFAHLHDMSTQARAKKGGEIGANGEFYEGGKFIARTEKAKSQKEAYRATRKQNVAPYVWEVAPEAGLVAIFPSLSGVEIFNRETGAFQFNSDLCGGFGTPEAIASRQHRIAAFNSGKRWHKPHALETA